MDNENPEKYLPEKLEAPWWLNDIEEYLELLHGDVESLLEQHGLGSRTPATIVMGSRPSHHVEPKKCHQCHTVYHLTKTGGTDTCPFCHATLKFIIAS